MSHLKAALCAAFFFCCSLLCAQDIVINEEVSTDNDPYVFEMPGTDMVEVTASFDLTGFLNGDPDMPGEPFELHYNFTDVTLPNQWTFESANFMMSTHTFFYPPATGTSFAPAEKELYGIELTMFGLNFGGNTAGGAIVFDLELWMDTMAEPEKVKLILSFCASDPAIDLISYTDPGTICPGTTVAFSAPPGYESYSWSGGINTQNAEIPIDNPTIILNVQDEMGCAFQDQVTLNLQTPASQTLCLVTIDENTGKNKLVWEKEQEQGSSSFNIYKQGTQANVYDLMATQEFGELSEYVDMASVPDVQSERYQISITDICGQESAANNSHKTMHLTSNLGVNNQANLIWEKYEGFAYSTFNIYRGSNAGDLTLIAERPSNTFTYTDANPPAGNLFYQIEIQAPFDCIPTEAVQSVTSNISQANTVSQFDLEIENPIQLFPNPVHEELFITGLSTAKENQIFINDHLGRLVQSQLVGFEKTVLLNVEDLPAGTYYCSVFGSLQNFRFVKI